MKTIDMAQGFLCWLSGCTIENVDYYFFLDELKIAFIIPHLELYNKNSFMYPVISDLFPMKQIYFSG